MPTYDYGSTLDATPDAVWAWHLRPGALERLIPPWEHVEVLRRSGGITDGGMVELRVGRGPFARRWVARHRDALAGRGFVDEQVEGPFGSWVHDHRFEPAGGGRTRMLDSVTYTPPLGAAGALADSLLIRRRLLRTFRYRHATLAEDLAAHRRAGLLPRTVAVTGASGLLGSALTAFLTTGGHAVRPLVRRRPGPGEIAWNPDAGTIDREALEGVDAVVHLAGESIGLGRWDAERKRRIRESRVAGTRLLAEALAGLARKPGVLVSASAIGIYGSRGGEELTEGSAAGTGFLAETGVAWEGAARPAADAGIRVVHPRFGLVLTPAGGGLAQMLPPFELGAGARLGDGRQWMSWVSLDDALGLILHALATPAISGPLNAVAPGTVTNRVFTETLGEVLHRPTLFSAPAAALRLAFGEMADALLLASQRVIPARAGETGYVFRHPDLRGALRHLLGRD
ncbi:MAG TPA: TIGR01777 family oxidoreductase [Gemmatimonadales bacterium]|nr:TIGR01777 family oxidoreductase [Gemmatimonadales bacterium]